MDSLEVEMYGLDVEFLRHHHPSHDGIYEEREQHITQKDENTCRSPYEHFLCGIHYCLIPSPQCSKKTHVLSSGVDICEEWRRFGSMNNLSFMCGG